MQTNDPQANGSGGEAAGATSLPSMRHVVEHALIGYGYSPGVARKMVDQLIAEGRDN